MTENFDPLNFNPSNLTAFSENDQQSYADSKIYRTRPAESVSKDGVYRATIKMVYNPFDLKNSILEQQNYAMQDVDGFFSVVSSLTVNDRSCPIFTAWKKCHYAKEGEMLKEQEKYFEKRFARWCIVQVLEDKNQPDLVGKYLFWKLPKSVLDVVNAKMKPSEESGRTPIPVMDFLFGRSIELEVNPGPDDKSAPERKTREISYMCEISDECVSNTNVDGSPLLTGDEQAVLDKYIEAMTPVWKLKDPEKRAEKMAEINADPNTVQLKQIYNTVLARMKEIVPDLNELSYHEWSDNQKERVQRWLDVVMSGGNPLAGTVQSTPVTGTESAANAEQAKPTTEPNLDDLPF